MSENWILHGPPCLAIPTLAPHHAHMQRAHNQMCIRDLECLSFFFSRTIRLLANASPICTLSSPYLCDPPHIWSLTWQQSFIIKWMEMLCRNLPIVRDNLVSFARWLLFYIWACSATSAPATFIWRRDPSVRLSVSQLITRESRSRKSYLREEFCLWRKASVSIHSHVSFEGARK